MSGVFRSMFGGVVWLSGCVDIVCNRFKEQYETKQRCWKYKEEVLLS